MSNFKVPYGKKLNLGKYDPEKTVPYSENDSGKAKAKEDRKKKIKIMSKIQERLFAEGKQALLVVLQAMDTGGKDSTIRSVFSPLNPQGCQVHSFKKPTDLELSHHFLWRIHQKVPRKGMITVFHRSHYEDILVTRVHGFVDDKLAQKHMDEIIQFEKTLVESGTQIIKFFLHISKDEQKKRLQDRIRDPEKHWKFNPDDLQERKKWNRYHRYYEEAMTATSLPRAPWYVIPANHKWVRNALVSSLVCQKLAAMNPVFPPPPKGLNFNKINIT